MFQKMLLFHLNLSEMYQLFSVSVCVCVCVCVCVSACRFADVVNLGFTCGMITLNTILS